METNYRGYVIRIFEGKKSIGLSVFCLFLIFSFGLCPGAEDGLSVQFKKAEKFLAENRLSGGGVVRPGNYVAVHRLISKTKDPESQFGYIVFSIARHSAQLLNHDQAVKLAALIESRKNAKVNWHDVRNIVRVHSTIAMWHYVSALDAEELAKRKRGWEAWRELRLAYMQEEFIAKERFQRAAWDILTAEQKQKLLSGEWDKFLKKNTGHKRLFFADRIVRRAVGRNPDNKKKIRCCGDSGQRKMEADAGSLSGSCPF